MSEKRRSNESFVDKAKQTLVIGALAVAAVAYVAEKGLDFPAFGEDKKGNLTKCDKLEPYYGTKEQIKYGADEAIDNIDLAYKIVGDKYPEWCNNKQMHALVQLWRHESGWRVHANNPDSAALGIPQFMTNLYDLPKGYKNSAKIQIAGTKNKRGGLEYIDDRYGDPATAWDFWQHDALTYDFNGDGQPDNAHWY